MISCFLCLKKKSKQIKMCSKKGQELQISSIITKHFWLKPNTQKNSKEVICIACWDAVRDFHTFYETIAEAHNFLDTQYTNWNTKDTDEFLIDPLPKPKDETKVVINNQSFNAEVKVEINELEFLPIEEVVENQPVISERTLRAEKRNKQVIENLNIENITNKQNNLDFKQNAENSDDSEIEIPLSMFLHSKTETENNFQPIDTENDVVDNTDSKKSPNKCRKAQTSKMSEIPKEPETNELAQLETNIKDEQSPLQNFEIFDNYNDDSVNLNENSNASDSDGIDCLEPLEKFAIIGPQRKPIKPKKYKKRTKPLKEPKRMTKEEIEMKRLEQEKYDEIIARLFDKFPCPKCNLFVRNFGDMRSHFNTSHDGKGTHVECCGRRFNLRKTLAEHILVHLNPEQFKCLKCEQIFQDSSSLKEHEDSHNLPPGFIKEKKTFDCEVCLKKLATKESLRNHILCRHTPKSEYEFTCAECNKKLPTKHLLKRHLKRDHGTQKAIICEKCGKTVQTPSLLKKHIEYAHSNIPRPEPERVQCKICGIWLRNIYTLKEHTQYLHDQSQIEHRCHICGYLSVNARSLKKHISFNHTLERKFKCTLCEKAFKRPHDLKEHTSTHTGEVLYTCSNCSMTFFCKANYHKHRQRRHGYQPNRRNIIGLTSKRQKKKPEAEKQAQPNDFSIEGINTQNLSNSIDQFVENL